MTVMHLRTAATIQKLATPQASHQARFVFRALSFATLLLVGAACLSSCSSSRFSYLQENVKGYGTKGPIVVLATQVHGYEQFYPMWLRQDPDAPTSMNFRGQSPEALDAVDQWLSSGFSGVDLISARRVDSLFTNKGLTNVSDAVKISTKHFNADAAVLIHIEGFGIQSGSYNPSSRTYSGPSLQGVIYLTLYNSKGEALWQLKYDGVTSLPQIPSSSLASQAYLKHLLTNAFTGGLIRKLLEIKNESSE